MSPRTRKPETGMITLHPFVVVLVGVTLKRFDQNAYNVNGELTYIPSTDIRVHMTIDIRKVGDSHLREHAEVFVQVPRLFALR